MLRWFCLLCLLAMAPARADEDNPNEKPVKYSGPVQLKTQAERDTAPGALSHVIQVSTTRELIENLGSSRTVVLLPGEYRLDRDKDLKSPHLMSFSTTGGRGLCLMGLTQLRIAGRGTPPPRIVTGAGARWTLAVEGGSGVVLENVELAMDANEGGEAVLVLRDLNSVTLVDCILSGGPGLGLSVSGCTGIQVQGGQISRSGAGILSVKKSSDVKFSEVNLADNAPGVAVDGGTDVVFACCKFANNSAGDSSRPLFSITGPPIRLADCHLTDNAASALVNDPKQLEEKDTKQDRNRFAPAPAPTAAPAADPSVPPESAAPAASDCDASGTWLGKVVAVKAGKKKPVLHNCRDHLTLEQKGDVIKGTCEFKDEAGRVYSRWTCTGRVVGGKIQYAAKITKYDMPGEPEAFRHTLEFDASCNRLSGFWSIDTSTHQEQVVYERAP